MVAHRRGQAELLVSASAQAGVDALVADDITAEVWRKFAFIASLAAACGLARAPVGPVRETPLGRLMIERAVREAVAVARSLGVNLAEDEETNLLRFVDALPAGIKPSLLLDLEAGGPTEIDDLSGAVARLGRQVGVATPVHDTAAAAIAVRGPASP